MFVRKKYGETVSWDPDTGEIMDTPPALAAAIEREFDALFRDMEPLIEAAKENP